MDLNDVKGGKYQLVAARWDQITSKPGEPLDYVRHRRGDIVDLNSEDAKRLVAAGAVVKPGALEKSKAEQAKAIADRAAADYQAVLAGLPESVRAEVAPGTVPADPADQSDDQGGEKRPSVDDVLAGVGEDPAKAAEALAAEREHAKPRKTLVEKLEKIAGSDQGGDKQGNDS